MIYSVFWREGERWGVSRRDLAENAAEAWSRCNKYLPLHAWRELFHLAGYRADDVPAERPTEPVELWRGATPEHRANWSWTDVRDAAVIYTSGWIVQDGIGLVWRAVVDPERLLAKVSARRGWSEYVVDTDGLAIEPDGLWCRCSVDLTPYRADSQTALDLQAGRVPRR